MFRPYFCARGTDDLWSHRKVDQAPYRRRIWWCHHDDEANAGEGSAAIQKVSPGLQTVISKSVRMEASRPTGGDFTYAPESSGDNDYYSLAGGHRTCEERTAARADAHDSTK